MADPRQNLILAALPAAEWARWLPHLETVDLPLGRRSTNRVAHYFMYTFPPPR